MPFCRFPRSARGGLLVKALLVLGALTVFVTLAWIVLLPGIVASTVRAKTGFGVKIHRLSVNPFTARVDLRGVLLENPAGWPESPPFLELREFRARAELLPLFANRFVADEVVLDVAQLTVVKNQDGVFNAVVFKDGLAGPSATERAPADQPRTGDAKPGFLIRRLVLKLDRLSVVDHSGRRQSVRHYPVAINREMRDVDSVLALLSPFTGAAFAVMSDVVGDMFSDTKSVFQETAGMVKAGGKKLGEALKGLMPSLEKPKP